VSPPGYLLGVVLTIITVGGLGYGATGVRRHFFPEWTGALGVLAVAVVAIAAADVAGELLGAGGLFDRWVVLPVLAVGGGAVGVWTRRGAEPVHEPTTGTGARATAGAARPSSLARASVVGALGIAALVFAQWGAHVVAAYRGGVSDGDSLWYHLPFATNFVQSGWTTHILQTGAGRDSLVTFFPANAEITTALAILPFGRDVLVPLVNLGWLGLALLGGWCIGRRYRQPAIGLAAVAVVASIPLMASTQGGTARNDIVSLALFLSVAAIVVHTSWDRPSLFLGGLAAGLAAGVKLSGVLPAVLVTVGVLLIAPRLRRKGAAAWWLSGAVLTGSFWYVRNFVLVGNPLPFVHLHVGPIDLPSALRYSIGNTAIADRLGEPGAWQSFLRPALHLALGPLWPVVLVLWVGGIVVAARRDVRTRMLALVIVAATVGYVVQPNGAPGHGLLASTIFALNLRYITPALALGLVLLAAHRFRAAERIELALVGVLGVVVVVDQFPRALQYVAGSEGWEWPLSDTDVALGLVLVLGAVVLAVVLRGRRRPRPLVLGTVAGVVGIIAVLGGYWGQRQYLDRRYARPLHGLLASAAFPWAQGLESSRLAISGNFFQYPLSGSDLATVVRYGGVEGPHGSFRNPRNSCEWRRFLADGHFRYAVLAPTPLGFDPVLAITGPATSAIPGATEVLHDGAVQVFRLPAQIDVSDCP
jgi:hypothetical protein